MPASGSSKWRICTSIGMGIRGDLCVYGSDSQISPRGRSGIHGRPGGDVIRSNFPAF